MNVQWIKKKLNGNGKGECLRAVLSENHLHESQVQLKPVIELGSIEKRFLSTKVKGTRAFHQGLFWVVVDKNLDKLGLEPGVRNQIESELAETVPRPNGDWAMWGVICVPEFDNASQSGTGKSLAKASTKAPRRQDAKII